MIKKDGIYINKETGDKVLLLYLMGFRLTYQDNGSLKTMSLTEFVEKFKEQGA